MLGMKRMQGISRLHDIKGVFELHANCIWERNFTITLVKHGCSSGSIWWACSPLASTWKVVIVDGKMA